MDFGSEYILDEEEEEEEMQEEEEMPAPVLHHRSLRPRPPTYAMGDCGGFECEIMDFDEEEEEVEESNQPAQQAAGKKPKKVDTNTVNLTMKSLNEKPDETLPASQKLNCQNGECGAVFSHLAKVTENSGKKIWKCPFCDAENEAAGDLPNLPDDKTDVMYVEDTNKLPNLVPPQDKNNYSIIFVVDTSASMCQTLQVPRAGSSPRLQELYDEELNRHKQYLDQMSPDDQGQILHQLQNSDMMEVSRLMLIKDAVFTILKELKSKKPDVSVGLVVFNEKVMVLGDGRSKVEVEGGQLADKAELQLIGKRHNELRPVYESADDLIKEMKDLQEEGRTALGPALLIAEKMTKSKGSKVILLTDGFANIGLGKLEETTQPEIDLFYDGLIETCKADGVSVSVITCDEAGIKNKLGDIPDETGGIVQKIEAQEYVEPLREELGRQVAATDGLLHFVVGKNMYVRVNDEKVKNSRHSKTIGNIHLGKKIPLKFAMRQPQAPASADAPATPADPPTNASTAADDTAPPTSGGTSPSTATGATGQAMDQTTKQDQSDTTTSKKADGDEAYGIQCPFQVLIKYTDVYGTTAWRVWTKQKQVTKSRQEAEDRMNVKSTMTSFMQTASDEILKAKNSYKLQELIQSLTAQCNDLQTKIKPDNRISLRQLLEFQELLMQVARSPNINDDLASKLRSYKNDRLVKG